MLDNVRKLLLGDTLSAASREQLTKWMLGNKTGDTRLQAQLPPGWRTGDKTGAGERGTNNDVGVLWPPEGRPIVVSVYLTGTSAPVDKRNATLLSAAPSRRAVQDAEVRDTPARRRRLRPGTP